MNGIWNYFSQTPVQSDPFSSAYNGAMNWITAVWNQAYSKLPSLDSLNKDIKAINLNKDFLWNHKEWVIGTTIAGVTITSAILLARHYSKKKLNQTASKEKKIKLPLLNAELKPSLEAKLYLNMNNRKPTKLKNTLVIGIDTSDSMKKEDRLNEIINCVSDIFKSLQKVVDTRDGFVEVAITAFDKESRIITSPVKIIPRTDKSNENTIESLNKDLSKLFPYGSTKILNGLKGATQQLKQMANDNPKASHTLVLLTDGEEDLKPNEISNLQEELASIKATSFFIGIGKEHKKETLKQLAKSKSLSGFNARYIDTTGKDTIESAIMEIFKHTISTVNDLQLSSSQLPKGTWSVDNRPSVQTKGQELSYCKLDSLSEGDKIEKHIKIHTEKLKDPLDLSKLTFTLSYTDRKGQRIGIPLVWNSNSIIQPELIKAE